MECVTSKQFAPIFALKPKRYVWLLGAGTSVAAGIPSGYQMILDFKATLFCQLSGVSRRDVDISDPVWQSRIADCLQRHPGLPPPGDPTEYAKTFEALYPTEGQRRQYIDNAVRKGLPTIGHRALAALMSADYIDCIFTTNFDQLVERSVTLSDSLLPTDKQSHPTVAAIDNADRADRVLKEADWPLIAKLHGDYQSKELKNTDGELETQDHRMRKVLAAACQRYGLIVVGYSGRDASVMATLNEALCAEGAFPAGLHWVTSDRDKLLPSVSQLLDNAHAVGVDASVVECPNFDEFCSELAEAVCLPPELDQHVFKGRPPNLLVEVPLNHRPALLTPILRCSALPLLAMPSFARRISLDQTSTTRRCQELLRAGQTWAAVACSGKEVAAFGNDAALLKALESLGPTLSGEVALHPDQDSWAHGLLYEALLMALRHDRPLYTRLLRKGHTIRVSRQPKYADSAALERRQQQLSDLHAAYSGGLLGTIDKLGCTYAEGVTVRLDFALGQWWCVFEPTTFVDTPMVEEDEDQAEPVSHAGHSLGEQVADWKRARWANRYNPFWTRAIAAWSEMFAGRDGETIAALGLKESEGVDAKFSIGPKNAFSRPAHGHAYLEQGRI